MSERAPKPIPVVHDGNRPFWDGARAHRLVVQQCSACGHLRYPIAAVCPQCLSDATEWTALSGCGTVFARAVYHRAFGANPVADVPYVLAIVQLEEGPRMISDIVDAGPEDVDVGTPVEVVFDLVSDDITVPRFCVREDQR